MRSLDRRRPAVTGPLIIAVLDESGSIVLPRGHGGSSLDRCGAHTGARGDRCRRLEIKGLYERKRWGKLLPIEVAGVEV